MFSESLNFSQGRRNRSELQEKKWHLVPVLAIFIFSSEFFLCRGLSLEYPFFNQILLSSKIGPNLGILADLSTRAAFR